MARSPQNPLSRLASQYQELLDCNSEFILGIVPCNDVILAYVKNDSPNHFTNVSDLHFLSHLFSQTTYVMITSENSD